MGNRRFAWFALFTAVFAVLAGFVFYGTWATDVVPVMPDCATSFPVDRIGDWLASWRESGKFVPGDAIVFLGSPYFWVELQYALAAYFAALGLAYYCRGRGLSRLASYGAGLLLAFCGYWFSLFSAGHLGWFQWMTYGVFAFGLADRAVRKGKAKNWVLLGACVAWASFYQPDLWLIFTVFTAAYFVWCCIRERRLPCWKGVAIAAVTFGAIAAPSLRGAAADKARRDSDIAEAKDAGSALTGGAAKDDAEARWIFVTNWSLPPAEILEFAVPRVNGDTSCPMVLALGKRQGTGVRPYTGALGRPFGAQRGNYRQHSLYLGLVTCILAALGAACSLGAFRRGGGGGGANRGEALFFLAAGALACLLSLGRNFEPLYRLVFMLPVGDSIRAPVKWHHLTELCVCVLAAFGIDALRGLLARFVAPRRASLAVGALVLLGACDLARIDRLYCAARAADTEIAQLPQPVPEEPRAAARFRRAVAANGFKVVGSATMPFLAPGGVARDMEVLMVERKAPRPRPRTAQKPLAGLPLAFAWLSFFATLAALAIPPCLSRAGGRGN